MSTQAKTPRSSVSTFSSLPTSGNVEGDFRLAIDNGRQYYWSLAATSGNVKDWRLLNDIVPDIERIDELLDVDTTGVVTGDVLAIEADGVWRPTTGSGSVSPAEKLNLELELEFKLAKLSRYIENGYTGKQITSIIVYDDVTKVLTLFSKVLTYVGNKLTMTVITRISDAATLTKVFAYTGNKLDSITVT
jgi:hypothetical protein